MEQDLRDEAVTLFLTEQVAVPEPVVAGMRTEPVWGWFTGLAHTLPYDAAVCGPGLHLPIEALAAIDVPTLVLDGGESPAWMRTAAEAVAAAVPGGRHVTVAGQDHGVLHHPAALLPALTEFLT